MFTCIPIVHCVLLPNRFVLQSYDQPCTMEFPCFTLYAAVFLRKQGFLVVGWLKTSSSSCNNCLFLCYMLGSPQLPGIDVAIHLSIKLFLIIYKNLGNSSIKNIFNNVYYKICEIQIARRCHQTSQPQIARRCRQTSQPQTQTSFYILGGQEKPPTLVQASARKNGIVLVLVVRVNDVELHSVGCGGCRTCRAHIVKVFFLHQTCSLHLNLNLDTILEPFLKI